MTLPKLAYFSKIYYYTKFQDRTLSGTSVVLISNSIQLPFWHYWW